LSFLQNTANLVDPSDSFRNNLRNLTRAIAACFIQQLKNTTVSLNSLTFLFAAIPTVGVYAWIALQSQDTSKFSYLLVGAPLMAIWNGVVFRTGWSLDDEMYYRTLEFAMISRTPMLVVLLGKALAQLAYGIPAGILSLLTMFAITHQMPAVANLPLLSGSVVFILIGLTVISLLFAPVLVLAGGKAGFFNGILPFGVLLSGFVFPVESLPGALKMISYVLPTSWSMTSAWRAIEGSGSTWSVVSGWVMCIVTSAMLFALTYILFKVIEKRIRITGQLGSY
jgi:ABC-type multidrug transport system permease subunit